MDYKLKEKFEYALLPNEHIRWCGRPNRKMHFSRSDLFAIPFSLFWGGFALFWNISVWQAGAPFFFRIFGLPFLIVGLYITFGRFFHVARKKRKTVYAITDLRILILSDQNLTAAQYLRDIPHETVTMRKNGNGTIVFGAGVPGRYTAYSHVSGRGAMAVFADIDDCREVYSTYQVLKHRARGDA